MFLWPMVAVAEKLVAYGPIAIKTAETVGFQYAEMSRQPREHIPGMHHGVIMMGNAFGEKLIAECFHGITRGTQTQDQVMCQVYAGQTGKVMNLWCDTSKCIIDGVIDIHR
jgi:hypothetical protein